jgi:hypothetical protein
VFLDRRAAGIEKVHPRRQLQIRETHPEVFIFAGEIRQRRQLGLHPQDGVDAVAVRGRDVLEYTGRDEDVGVYEEEDVVAGAAAGPGPPSFGTTRSLASSGKAASEPSVTRSSTTTTSPGGGSAASAVRTAAAANGAPFPTGITTDISEARYVIFFGDYTAPAYPRGLAQRWPRSRDTSAGVDFVLN